MTEGYRNEIGAYRQKKENSSGKDTRKENEKATKPAREKAYHSVLFELHVSLLHYFSAVYDILET